MYDHSVFSVSMGRPSFSWIMVWDEVSMEAPVSSHTALLMRILLSKIQMSLSSEIKAPISDSNHLKGTTCATPDHFSAFKSARAHSNNVWGSSSKYTDHIWTSSLSSIGVLLAIGVHITVCPSLRCITLVTNPFSEASTVLIYLPTSVGKNLFLETHFPVSGNGISQLESSIAVNTWRTINWNIFLVSSVGW